MSLVPSLLQAVIGLDGEALVIHVGEKPYVVAPSGQVELATRALTFEAVTGILEQMLREVVRAEVVVALEPQQRPDQPARQDAVAGLQPRGARLGERGRVDDQLVGRVQERYGIAKDEAERQVKDWTNRM